jgi:HEXXH motif-containing protein
MVHGDELRELAANRITAGQRELADAMRVLVARAAPEIAEALVHRPDETFLEPLLFAYFSEKEPGVELGQLLVGALPPSERPEAVEVRSDAAGRVYVPGIGYFATELPSASLLLELDGGGGHALSRVGRRVACAFEELLYVPGTRIEVARHQDPLLATRFLDTSLRRAEVEVDGHGERHLEHLSRALGLIRELCPSYHAELARTVRQVVVFRASDVNSFATVNAHGTVFLGAGPQDDEAFFFDELVHQCGHVVFNALTVRRRDFLAVEPSAELGTFAPDEQDGRTVYDAFHGLYTEHVMSSCMRTLDECGVLSGRLAHELFGRLSFITQKFAVDLANLSAQGIFTDLGREIYAYFAEDFRSLAADRPDLLATDMKNQPYTFSYDTFARDNAAQPGPGR